MTKKDPVELEQLLNDFVESLRPDQLRALATKLRPDQKKALRGLLSPDQRSVVDETADDEAASEDQRDVFTSKEAP